MDVQRPTPIATIADSPTTTPFPKKWDRQACIAICGKMDGHISLIYPSNCTIPDPMRSPLPWKMGLGQKTCTANWRQIMRAISIYPTALLSTPIICRPLSWKMKIGRINSRNTKTIQPTGMKLDIHDCTLGSMTRFATSYCPPL